MSAPAPRRRSRSDERPGSCWAVIAGGGTAGHVLPGISVAQQIVDRGARRDAVHFVGSSRGVETRLVPEAGFGLTALPGRGLQRRLALSNLAAATGLVRAFARALIVLRCRRPAVVLG
ncbi:MAG: UDP-N-acetylglucosamine--N-acetylmuramyl-(pentapeptide) pyrophosphoryl-undecaprenol N-acetylglucosamine transferase, partial [Acidimicrobiaceae bacterium]|nr:UDP-N-acetylglucosamine--N-acetylmuramyl-(pentapeptide) pyrophosphoryl-undecaprenol N-acetylglucosamine transferase [Acidimicrobiaceae bacterium]